MTDSHNPHHFLQYSREGIESVQSNVAIESSVALTVNGQVWLTFHCTPVDIEALALGFLFNEGFIQSIAELENTHICSQKDNIDVWLNHAVKKPESWQRTTGCGGGTSSVEPEKKPFEPIQNNTTLKPEQVFGLMDQFMTEQPAHSQYGGVHTSALADCGTQLLQINDIGRHNTIDKIAGRILLDRLEVQTPVLVTSGRISSDMVQKAARMRAPFLVSMRSASDQGIALAKTYGITLISGARRGRFFLFSHPERITSS